MSLVESREPIIIGGKMSSISISKSFLQALEEMDEADLQDIEQNLHPIPEDEIRNRIESVKGQFFSVDFARKTDKKVNGVIVEPKGMIRHMLCRRGVGKYVKGVLPEGQRQAEDERNSVLTVWDVGVYQSKRKEGMEQEIAGEQSYRRINMADVKCISIASIGEVEQEKVATPVPDSVEV